MYRILISIGIITLTFGCGDASQKPVDGNRPKSSAQLMLEGVTGKQAVESGKKMESELNQIAEDRDQQLNQIFGE